MKDENHVRCGYQS